MDLSQLSNFCRLCLCSSGGLLDVYDASSRSGHCIIGMIQDLLHLKVVRGDSLPWMICHLCMSRLQEFQCFKSQCMRSKLVLDGMLSLDVDGGNTVPFLKCKRKEQHLQPSTESFVNTLGKGFSWGSVDGDRAENAFNVASSPSFGLSTLTEEAIDDEVVSVVEYCWCSQCGVEFLSPRELKTHYEWCNGRRRLVWNLTSEDHKEEEMLVDVSSERVNQQLFDPNICCGRCRKVFKTKEHLIRHIDKYDFKCKPKESYGSPTDAKAAVCVDGKIIPHLSIGNHAPYEEQTLSLEDKNRIHILNLGVTKCCKGFQDQKHWKFNDGEQNGIGKDVLNVKNRETKQYTKKTKSIRLGKGSISKSKSLSLSQCLIVKTKNTATIYCGHCGKAFKIRELLSQHLSNCSLGLNDESSSNFNLSPGNNSEKHSNKISASANDCHSTGEADFSIILDKNEASRKNFKSKEAQIEVPGLFVDKNAIAGKVELYICDYCKKSCCTKPDLRSHIVKCHLSLNPQKCNVCHRFFTNCDELQEHSSLHPEGKKFFCTVCEKSFSTRDALRGHIMESHSVNKAFTCTICFNGFTSKSDVGLHLSLMHTESEKPFKCTKCGKSYTDKYMLDLHIKVSHLKIVSFQCNICGKSQTSKINLANHSTIHSAERNFACPNCPKRFRLISQRNSHVRIVHLKFRPFECGICNKRFGLKGDLNRHYSLHSDMRSFLCPQCPKSFKRKSYLTKHLYCIHGIS